MTKLRIINVVKNNVLTLLEKQYQKGMQKYNTPLQTFNGRDAYIDLMEELVDGLMYATQLREEMREAATIIVNSQETTKEEKEKFIKYL